MAGRDGGREIEHYRRASLRERILEPILWLRARPAAAILVAILVVGTIGSVVAPPLSGMPKALRVGDCLYVPTNAAITSDRPIGEAASVARVLLDGGAEQASCDASHGHEVIATVIGPASAAEVQAACAGEFPGYVGRSLTGSRYAIFTVIPTAEDVAAGRDIAVCLIARADGQWMNHPARNSAE